MARNLLASSKDWGALSPCDNVSMKTYTILGSCKNVSNIVQRESTLTIEVSGRAICTLSCSQDHLEELAIGHLLAEGVITSYDEITDLKIDEAAETVSIQIISQPTAAAMGLRRGQGSSERFLTSSGAKLVKVPEAAHQPMRHIQWAPSWAFQVAWEFERDKTSHARTRGCHSAYLASRDEILCMREDVGRHNAFDKVLGWALINGVNLGECMLYTSGRVPADMVSKAVNAGIPILASKSVTTDKAVELAREAGLVLLCEARSESFKLVSGNAPTFKEEFARAI